ncbi:MAG TPA: hypothetical protein VNO22_08795 [Planctomycetota bacterium]|nr:hypothetical protein [Planctomycetota bacterium]
MIPPVLTLLVAGAAPLWGQGARFPDGARLAVQAAPEPDLSAAAVPAPAAEAAVPGPVRRPFVPGAAAPFAFPETSAPPSYDWRSPVIFDVP